MVLASLTTAFVRRPSTAESICRFSSIASRRCSASLQALAARSSQT
jgi:hypothetical protein